jgi:hypothetical protein
VKVFFHTTADVQQFKQTERPEIRQLQKFLFFRITDDLPANAEKYCAFLKLIRKISVFR